MRRLKLRLTLSKLKRTIKLIKRTIKLINSQRIVITRRALKSLKEPLQFIKKEPISFATAFFLTQKLLYILLIIEPDLLAILNLCQSKSTQACIQKKSQAIAQPQLRLTTQKGRDRYSSQEQPLYQASILTQYTSKSLITRESTRAIKRTLFTTVTIRRTPIVTTTVVRLLLNIISQRRALYKKPYLRLDY